MLIWSIFVGLKEAHGAEVMTLIYQDTYVPHVMTMFQIV